MQESNRSEYKRELNERFERAVVSFLNYSGGGEILVGVDDDGTTYGVADTDAVQLQIVDRIRNNIRPQNDTINGKINDKINGKINSVLDILKNNPRATIPDLMEATGKGQRTISRELKEYQEAGLLRREGSRKTGHWAVE